MRILLIQGANMEWLGIRQPEIYGTITAAELDAMLMDEACRREVELDIRYTNIEGEAIDMIYAAARDEVDGLMMNPAGFHYAGHALADCIKGVSMPYVEVHISNLDRRGMRSVMAAEADGLIMGLGLDSYFLGLDAMIRVIGRKSGA